MAGAKIEPLWPSVGLTKEMWFKPTVGVKILFFFVLGGFRVFRVFRFQGFHWGFREGTVFFQFFSVFQGGEERRGRRRSGSFAIVPSS